MYLIYCRDGSVDSECPMAKTVAQQQLIFAAKSGNSEATLHLLVEDGVYINSKDTLGMK